MFENNNKEICSLNQNLVWIVPTQIAARAFKAQKIKIEKEKKQN